MNVLAGVRKFFTVNSGINAKSVHHLGQVDVHGFSSALPRGTVTNVAGIEHR